KRYRIGGAQTSYKTLRESLISAASAPVRWLKGQRHEKNTFWALQDVSFEIKQGEAVGIIGRNGAGKSTLLKILSRITKPTTGRVELFGRVGSLLEVGTGFHPELTGRDNIFLNGAILGMSRQEIMRKFDEIVAFAEIDKFLDTPVKFYSSGMYVRLAFAVAAHLEPEILVVDEVLAVGDAEFQKKCLGKMKGVVSGGRTVLFVSHNMSAITQLCTESLVLNAGKVLFKGDVNSGIQSYLKYGAERKGDILQHAFYPNEKLIELKSIEINNSTHDEISLGNENYQLRVIISGIVNKPTRIALEARLHDTTGGAVATFSPAHFMDKNLKIFEHGLFNIRGKIILPILTQGQFYLSIFLTDPSVQGLCSIPFCLSISSSSMPLISFGSTLSVKDGHGMFILKGDFEVSQ
ncbi:MAG: hypothetical protein C0410_14185, partial [Anaerolinea sp.]|nr:hypothetical protein [Anaerolinea sp.]